MKKLTSLILLAFTCFFTSQSCMHRHDNGHVEINITESGHEYSMNAEFSRSKTREVEEYMNRQLGNTNNFSFVNTQTNAEFTLDDHTKFFMKKSPGNLEIQLDKDENSNDAYRRVKAMCEGIKKVIAK